MYKPKHFKIQELVDRQTYETFHEDVLWKMFDERCLRGLDWLKRHFPKGSIIVNDWLWGGTYTDSGLRAKHSDFYKEGSGHSVGGAFDLKFTEYSIDEVAEFLLTSPETLLYFTRMEDITYTRGRYQSWLHLDRMKSPYNLKQIYIFKP